MKTIKDDFYWSEDGIAYLRTIKRELEKKLSDRAAQVAYAKGGDRPTITEKDIKEFAEGVLDEMKQELKK